MKKNAKMNIKIAVSVITVVLLSTAIVRAAIPQTWTEDSGNPLFNTADREYYPSVILIDGTYYMYTYGTGGMIDYATSPDGITWTKQGSTGVAGNHPWVIKDDTDYKMYYWDTSIPKWIGYATSTNGITWTDMGVINIASLPGSSSLYDWVVIYNGPGDYEAWGDDNFGLIVYSTSSDGVNWAAGQRVTINEIPTSYTRPHVIKDRDGNYHMWIGYQDASCPHIDGYWNSMIGYAYGTSPTSFTASGSNPIFSRCDDPIGWRPKRTYTPMVIPDCTGDTMKMYFTGKMSGGSYYDIGLATQPLEPILCPGPATKAEILQESGVPGKGLDKAPGLQKPFNPKSQAAEQAGKK